MSCILGLKVLYLYKNSIPKRAKWGLATEAEMRLTIWRLTIDELKNRKSKNRKS